MILYVYSLKSSQSNKQKIKLIENRLLSIYPNIISMCYDEFMNLNLNNVSILIFSGGDGIFNQIINKCVKYEHIIFGYIPLGTANDIGHNIGIKNIESSIDVIRNNKIGKMDLLEVNNRYFIYALSAGPMSAVSIKSITTEKKVFHKFVYRIRGMFYMFKKPQIVDVVIDGKETREKCKVVMVIKTRYLGGVYIGKQKDVQVVFVRSIWDLVRIFILKHPKGISFKTLLMNTNSSWCVDGEPIDIEKGYIKLSDRSFNIFIK